MLGVIISQIVKAVNLVWQIVINVITLLVVKPVA